MKANTIRINGNLYDITTGKRVEIGAEEPAAPPVKKSITIKQEADLPKSASSDVAKPSIQINVHAAERSNGNSIRRNIEHSHTLHRRAVRAPSQFEVEATTPKAEKPEIAKKTDPTRLDRAQAIARSESVWRFSRPAPITQADTATDDELEETEVPIVDPEERLQTLDEAKPRQTKSLANHIFASQETLEATDFKEDKQQDDSFERHFAKPKKAKRPRKAVFSTFAAMGMAGLLIAGYVAYLNMPNLSMKVAANGAGFAANMPGQTPSGYSMAGPVNYAPGQITINFSSNTDNGRRFSIKQQPSSWDSKALRDNYVAKLDSNYGAYEDKGLTIYTYGGGNAAWVNQGKLYDLDAKSTDLTIEQIQDLATSM